MADPDLGPEHFRGEPESPAARNFTCEDAARSGLLATQDQRASVSTVAPAPSKSLIKVAVASASRSVEFA